MEGKFVKGRYKITYILPHTTVTQKLNLIEHNCFLKVYKPLALERDEKKEYLKWLKKRKHKTDEQRKMISELAPVVNSLDVNIKELFGGDKIFTTESPLYKSIENGGYMILPPTQGSSIRADLEEITDSAKDVWDDFDFNDD